MKSLDIQERYIQMNKSIQVLRGLAIAAVVAIHINAGGRSIRQSVS